MCDHQGIQKGNCQNMDGIACWNNSGMKHRKYWFSVYEKSIENQDNESSPQIGWKKQLSNIAARTEIDQRTTCNKVNKHLDNSNIHHDQSDYTKAFASNFIGNQQKYDQVDQSI